MSLGTTVLWDWLFGLVLTVGSFGQIFGLISKLQNSLTFVWKLTPGQIHSAPVALSHHPMAAAVFGLSGNIVLQKAVTKAQ